jgi:UrcA family protein
MRSRAMRKSLFGVAVGLFSAVLVSSIAVAQQIEEVIVEASHIVQSSVTARDPATGGNIVSMTVSYGVSYAGLDLASKAGAAELEKRVKNAALAACKDISREYPLVPPNDATCAKQTADKAMVKVHELVAAAGKKSAK